MENAEAFKLSVDEEGEEEEAIDEDADFEGEMDLGREAPFISIAAATAVAAEG